MLSLSTSWNAFRHEDGKQVIFEIKELGFSDVELSFNLTPKMVKDIGELAKSSINVTSLHNFCPIPEGVERKAALPDCFSMASLDEEERRSAVTYTSRTIETAAQLGAKAVVLHAGRAEYPDKTRILIEFIRRGLKKTRQYRVALGQVVKEREQKAPVFFENTLRSLEELNNVAQRLGVKLGIETRFYYREIPNFGEIRVILDKFKGSSIYYWHDTGHANIMEQLGLAGNKGFLEEYAKDLLGIHLHDVSDLQDHQPPGKGSIDFDSIKKYVKHDHIKVIEAHHPATGEDIKMCKEFLETKLNGK